MLNGLASIMPAPLKVCINMYTQVMKRQMDAVASPLGNTPQRLNVVVIRPNWPNPWLNSAHLAVTDLCRASTLAGFSTLVCHKLVLKIGRPIFISPKQLRYRDIWKPSAGWNSMGRLVVPFLQSPEPVLEKKTLQPPHRQHRPDTRSTLQCQASALCGVWSCCDEQGAQLSTWDTHPDKPNHFTSLTAASGLSPPQGKLQVKQVKHSPHPRI